jgi:hypothetical protein
MAQTGRSNVRYVDPQRRYTVVLSPSWNAPFGALPHDDRAGTHDSADGRCGSYASIGRGQAALWITSEIFVAVCSPLESGTSAAAGDGASRADGLQRGAILERVGMARRGEMLKASGMGDEKRHRRRSTRPKNTFWDAPTLVHPIAG